MRKAPAASGSSHDSHSSSSLSQEPLGVIGTTDLPESAIFYVSQKPHHKTGKPLTIKHLNLTDFKRIECPRKNAPHNHKSCYFYHSIKDKRRDDDLYTPELCKFADTERCPKKDKCRRAHNRVERLYHKDKYKTKFCHCYPSKIGQCEYGEYCSFAHSVEDIKVRLIHQLLPANQDYDFYIFYFKTEWCPYNHEHNKAQCVYAHNFQDFRRKPNLFRYDTELCEDWQSGTFITCYEEGCKRLEKCTFSHGWKEQQFHPLVYKTQPCEEQKCFKGFECPFYHSPKDRRSIDQKTMKDPERLFIPKERSFSCPQQPNITELYFDNNLNHLKELQNRNLSKPQQTYIEEKKENSANNSRVITDQRAAGSEEVEDDSFEIFHRTASCTCPKSDKQKSQEHFQKHNLQKTNELENHEDEELPLPRDQGLQIHESRFTQSVRHQPTRLTPEEDSTRIFLPQQKQGQWMYSGTEEYRMSGAQQFHQPPFSVSHRMQPLGHDLMSPFSGGFSQQMYGPPHGYTQSPQNFNQGFQRAAFHQSFHQQHQQASGRGSMSNQSQAFYPTSHMSPQYRQQLYFQQHQQNQFAQAPIASPPGLVHPSQMQHPQHFQSMQNRPLPSIDQLQRSLHQLWLEDQQQQQQKMNASFQTASIKQNEFGFTSHQSTKIFDPMAANEQELREDLMRTGKVGQVHRKLTYDSQIQPNQQLVQQQQAKQTNPLQRAVTQVQEQEKAKRASSGSNERTQESTERQPSQFDIDKKADQGAPKTSKELTTPHREQPHLHHLTKSVPHQVTPPTPFTDSSYQDKLNNLAESYKKLNLDFTDIQEEEFESQFATASYNIERSLGLHLDQDSPTKPSLSKHYASVNEKLQPAFLPHQHKSDSMSPFTPLADLNQGYWQPSRQQQLWAQHENLYRQAQTPPPLPLSATQYQYHQQYHTSLQQAQDNMQQRRGDGNQ